MKNKLLISVVIFLFLIPFRLPISILFTEFFEWVIESTTKNEIPLGTLAVNVIVSKIIYNLILSSYFVYHIEMYSRERMGRKAVSTPSWSSYRKNEMIYWWIVPISLILIAFIIIDSNSIYNIMYTVKPVVTK